jgi:hypothetical protein
MQTAKSIQTERVTYLTSAEHKAALEAFAKARGESVGNVVREATARYIAQPPEASDEDEAVWDLLAEELEVAIPRWNAKFDSMEASLDRAHKAVRKALAEVEATK